MLPERQESFFFFFALRVYVLGTHRMGEGVGLDDLGDLDHRLMVSNVMFYFE